MSVDDGVSRCDPCMIQAADALRAGTWAVIAPTDARGMHGLILGSQSQVSGKRLARLGKLDAEDRVPCSLRELRNSDCAIPLSLGPVH